MTYAHYIRTGNSREGGTIPECIITDARHIICDAVDRNIFRDGNIQV